jgi:RNA-binding motif X-linked protein 2
MNVVREIGRINEEELRRNVPESSSWHATYRGSAWVYASGLQPSLSEGDVIAVFSQWGEIEDIHLIREEETGKSRGFAFIKYEDWRSTVLAVDNFNGTMLLGRTLRVDHKLEYNAPKAKKERDAAGNAIERASDIEAAAHISGHAYVGKELKNEFTIEQGVNLFASNAPSANNVTSSGVGRPSGTAKPAMIGIAEDGAIGTSGYGYVGEEDDAPPRGSAALAAATSSAELAGRRHGARGDSKEKAKDHKHHSRRHRSRSASASEKHHRDRKHKHDHHHSSRHRDEDRERSREEHRHHRTHTHRHSSRSRSPRHSDRYSDHRGDDGRRPRVDRSPEGRDARRSDRRDRSPSWSRGHRVVSAAEQRTTRPDEKDSRRAPVAPPLAPAPLPPGQLPGPKDWRGLPTAAPTATARQVHLINDQDHPVHPVAAVIVLHPHPVVGELHHHNHNPMLLACHGSANYHPSIHPSMYTLETGGMNVCTQEAETTHLRRGDE